MRLRPSLWGPIIELPEINNLNQIRPSCSESNGLFSQVGLNIFFLNQVNLPWPQDCQKLNALLSGDKFEPKFWLGLNNKLDAISSGKMNWAELIKRHKEVEDLPPSLIKEMVILLLMKLDHNPYESAKQILKIVNNSFDYWWQLPTKKMYLFSREDIEGLEDITEKILKTLPIKEDILLKFYLRAILDENFFSSLDVDDGFEKMVREDNFIRTSYPNVLVEYFIHTGRIVEAQEILKELWAEFRRLNMPKAMLELLSLVEKIPENDMNLLSSKLLNDHLKAFQSESHLFYRETRFSKIVLDQLEEHFGIVTRIPTPGEYYQYYLKLAKDLNSPFAPYALFQLSAMKSETINNVSH